VNHLFEDWESIQVRIQQARGLVLFLDYDGTLTPIVSQPELALCPPEVKRHLDQLRDLPSVYLTIISGRSLEDVKDDALAASSIKAMIDPKDIAQLAVFLASDAAKSISGQVIPIDNDRQKA